jgi:hypothetical protein
MKTRTTIPVLSAICVLALAVLLAFAFTLTACGGGSGGGGGADTPAGNDGGGGDNNNGGDPAITGVSITEKPGPSVRPDELCRFKAVVNGTGTYNANVTWAVSGSVTVGNLTQTVSTLSFTIPAGVIGGNVTITASAAGDSSKKDTVTLTIDAEKKYSLSPSTTDLAFDTKAVLNDAGSIPLAKTFTVANTSNPNGSPATVNNFKIEMNDPNDETKYTYTVTSGTSTDITTAVKAGTYSFPAGSPPVTVSVQPAFTTPTNPPGQPYAPKFKITGTGCEAKYVTLSYEIVDPSYSIKLHKDTLSGAELSGNTAFTSYIENILPASPNILKVMIENTGNQATGVLDVTATMAAGTPAGSCVVRTLADDSNLTTIAAGVPVANNTNAGFLVKPAATLTGGTYGATITVKRNDANPANLQPVSFTVSLTVTAADWKISLTKANAPNAGTPINSTPPYAFANLKDGYTAQNATDLALKITAAYNGNQPETGDLTVTITSTPSAFTLGDAGAASVTASQSLSTILKGETKSNYFTITPLRGNGAAGLTANDITAYSGTVEIKKTDATVVASFTVQFFVNTLNVEELFDKTVKEAIGDEPTAPDLSGLSLANQITAGYLPRITRIFTLLGQYGTSSATIDLSTCTGLGEWNVGHGNLSMVETLTLPTTCTSIAARTFETGSPQIIIGAGVTEIKASAFSGASDLTTATFVKASNIGDNAFLGCSNLTTLTLKPSSTAPTTLGDNVFGGTNTSSGTLQIKVGDAAAVAKYKEVWGVANPAASNTESKYGTSGHKKIEIVP